MERKRNSDVLEEMLDLDGAAACDVGCGDGHLVRLMARAGAQVTGIETEPARVARAEAHEAVGRERYVVGRAESLPFEAGSLDVVVFFNSLHHVPVEDQPSALAEAARVLKTGGVAYICEPVAEGPHFEMMQPAHDETVVRAAALEAIRDSGRWGLAEEKELLYVHPVRYRAFEAFRERITVINPQIVPRFDEIEADLRARFERLGRPVEDGFEFDQPNRVNLLRKG